MRCLLVGYGRMGANHKRVLELLGHDVVTVDPAGHGDYRRVGNAPGVDFACIATPIGSLADAASVLIARKIPTLVEKPMAVSSADASELAEHALCLGVPLQVGYVEHFNPAGRAFWDALSAFETVDKIVARRSGPPDGRELPPVALDLASHEIHAFLVNGKLKSYAQTASREAYSSLSRFTNGAIGQIEADRLGWEKHRSLRAYGDEKCLELDYERQRVTLYEPDGVAQLKIVRAEPLLLQWQSFFAAMRHGEPEVSGDIAVEVLELIENRRGGGLNEPVASRKAAA